LLIVSPAFPPASAPDLHRVRTSLRYYPDFGWDPAVLAIDATELPGPGDPDLAASIPAGVPVRRVGAIAGRWTRPLGVGNPAFRAGWPLYRAGLDMMRRSHTDLVFFSTTMFPAMALGRLWKRSTGVPYVLDMQDPWLEDADQDARFSRPPKYRLARRLHAVLEPFAMRGAGGLVSVSSAYIDQLRRRYDWLQAAPAATIPFGVDPRDFDLADRLPWRNPFFTPGDGTAHLAYVGRAGANMSTAATIVCRALRYLDEKTPHRAALWCIGTDYAPAGTGRPTFRPIADREGVGPRVVESTDRLPYLHGLRVLRDADVLMLIGSHDERYMPSKLPVYLTAGRPVAAVLRDGSPAVDLLRRAGGDVVVTFRSSADVERAACELGQKLAGLVAHLPVTPERPAEVLAPLQARELTRRQCAVFDAVVARAAGPR
jgi:hypothetical protein